MGEVVSLGDHGSVVETLSKMLERAKAGEIAQVAVAYSKHDGTVGHTWSAGGAFGTLLGSIQYMSVQFAINPMDVPR